MLLLVLRTLPALQLTLVNNTYVYIICRVKGINYFLTGENVNVQKTTRIPFPPGLQLPN